MRGIKAALMLNRIFSITLSLIFIILFGSVIWLEYIDNLSHGMRYAFSLVAFVLITLLFFALYLHIRPRDTRNLKSRIRTKFFYDLSDKSYRRYIFVIFAVLFAIQLTIGYFLECYAVTDLRYLNRYATSFAENGNFNLVQSDCARGGVYLSRYPNNIAITLLLSGVYRIAYLIFGYVPMFVPVALNAFAINISMLITVFTAKLIYGKRKSVVVLIISLLFAPYYIYIPYYYTDSLSMPFCIGAIYLFILALQSENRKKKYAFAVFSALSVLVGFKIKGSVVILAAVFVVYAFLKLKFKKAVCICLAFVISFGCAYLAYNSFEKSTGIVTQEQREKNSYPLTHWVMMGLKGHGHYNYPDSRYTSRFPDLASKQEATVNEIKCRIDEMGALGLIKHLIHKSTWTWGDGTYYISHHIQKPARENILHSFVLKDGKHYSIFFAYSCGFQLFLILMICLSALKGIKRINIDSLTILKGVVFVVFIFFLIWETRSRYLFNFTPVFILLAVDGLDYMKQLYNYVKNKIKT